MVISPHMVARRNAHRLCLSLTFLWLNPLSSVIIQGQYGFVATHGRELKCAPFPPISDFLMDEYIVICNNAGSMWLCRHTWSRV